MASFNEISRFVNKYLSSDGKNVETITSFVKLDEEKIKNEKDNILEFLANNIYFMHEDGCPLINLTKDLEDNTWNNLTTAFEYEVFEQLVAISFEVGLLEDDFGTRMKLSSLFGPKGNEYLSDRIVDYEEFLSNMVNRVLPYYSFKFNSYILAKFMPPLELDEEAIKELLNRWFYYYSHEPYTFADLEYFNSILDARLNDVLDYALFEYTNKRGSTNTVLLCRTKQLDLFLDTYIEQFNEFYKKMSDEHRDIYDEEIKSAREMFFNQISLTYQEYNVRRWKKYE